MRIALVFPTVGRGTVDWSGVPAGLARGITAAGHEPVLVPLGLPHALRRASDVLALIRHRRRGLGAMTAPAVRRRTREAHRHIGAVDGVVLMGTTFEIPAAVPYVTYDDMTVPQFACLQQLPAAVERPWRARQAKALAGAAGCCAAGDWVAESLAADYGVDRARIAVVGMGANVVSPPVQERDWGVPRFLFIGVDWERKGGQRVVAAFRHVRESFPAATLDVIGRTPGIGEPGVTDHGSIDMRTPAGLDALLAAYRRATCFVMPSRFEPFGLVYVEAGLAGVPSIGTTVGGAVTAIGPGGVTVDPADRDALVRAMLMLAEPEATRRYGALAHAHARQFTWENVARRVVAALDVAPGTPGPGAPRLG